MAEMIVSAGFYNSEELADASTAGRPQLYKIRSEGRAGWDRLLRKVLGAKSPPAEEEAGKSLPYKEANVLAAIRASPALSGVGGLPRPRQEAVNMFPEALPEGSGATPPYAPLLAPKLGGSPWALQNPASSRAFEAEKDRQMRNAARTSFLNTGQLS